MRRQESLNERRKKGINSRVTKEIRKGILGKGMMGRQKGKEKEWKQRKLFIYISIDTIFKKEICIHIYITS